jgi:hypothetical protein
MTREDFIKTHLSGQEPRCDMGGLITTATYNAMYYGPHREMIQRHYEYAFELALDAYDVGIKTILATMELVEKHEQGE